ncbi:MAG TPA: NAD(P)/FAD-dependent oxidoreductase [Vicinamibacteria bacterium]|nr:NAD(P)/FAD-dependent oxidoreductase [Vicinamibacteria bacterium]
MSADRRDVLVAGAGPAGCATAIFLRQRGWDVLLVDAARFPRDKVCGDSVSPEGWRLLDALGAGDAVRALSPQPLLGMRLTAPDGTAFAGDYDGAARPGFALRRVSLDHALLQQARAAGCEVREETSVADVLRTDGRVEGVTLRAAGADAAGPCRARVVVAAEGRRSVVARRLGLLAEHRRLRCFAVRGYWDGMQGLGPRGEMHVGGGGYCGIAPLSPATANVAFVLERPQMAAAGGDLEGFYRRALRERWPRLAERLQPARLCGAPRAIAPLALSAPRVWTAGALLVGDAAGFYDPFTGEGVTLALRGAELAAEVIDAALRRGATDDLSAYQRARDAATRAKFRFNHLLQQAVVRPWLANAVARRLSRRPDLAARMVGIAGDFVPAREAFGARFVLDLLRA